MLDALSTLHLLTLPTTCRIYIVISRTLRIGGVNQLAKGYVAVNGKTWISTQICLIPNSCAKGPSYRTLWVSIWKIDLITQGFSTLAYWTLGPNNSLLWGHLVYCGLFNGIPGLHIPGANNNPPTMVTTKRVSRHCQMSLRDNVTLSWESSS